MDIIFANNLSPSYLSNIVLIRELPPQVGRLRQNINSRTNCGDFPTTRTRLKLLDNLFPAIATKLWNALPPKPKSLNSIGSFKQELYKLYFPDSLKHKFHEKLFGHRNRSMNIFHSCLRMECSKFNAHLKNNLHVIDHESCRCVYPTEDIQHFFFSCPLYDTIGASFITIVQAVINVEVSAELLLFGSYNLSVEQNLTIIDAVHLFLNKSRRFLND